MGRRSSWAQTERLSHSPAPSATLHLQLPALHQKQRLACPEAQLVLQLQSSALQHLRLEGQIVLDRLSITGHSNI